MAFVDYLNSAKKFHFPKVPRGRYSSIGDFYAAVVKDNEIKPEVLKGWTELLYRYVDNDDAIVFVRKLEKSERRGFRTMLENGFSYVFSDNTLATIIYAMAKFEIVPKDGEFYDYIRLRNAMPLSMRPNGAEQSELCAFRWYGHPNQNGWKLAHINDINNAKEYAIDYEHFQHTYFQPGSLREWRIDPTEGPIRRYGELPADDRKIFAAHFLRFCNPLNYFLVPNCKTHELLINGTKFGRGIGEYNAMKHYVDQKLKGAKALGPLYKDYLGRILSAGIAQAADDNIEIRTYSKEDRVTAEARRARTRRPQKTVKGGQDNKGARRLIRWVGNPNSNPYRIIRAFFACCNEYLVAELRVMRALCGDAVIHPDMWVESFDGCFASLKTNAGNSYGMVFSQDGTHVSLCPDIKDRVIALRDLFIS